jgi:hypothetical protein
MTRIVLVSVGVLLVLALASQLALPSLLEGSVQSRLERDGGSADVSLSAFPAVRLLFSDGASLEVEGRGLRLPGEPEGGELDRIDGFSEVRIALDDTQAGPLAIERFRLTREDGERDYELRLAAMANPREVGRILGGALGELGAGALLGVVDVPVSLTATVRSEDGRARAIAVQGSVAGIPAGPLAELALDAVLRRL